MIKFEYICPSSDNVQVRVFDAAGPTAVRILTKYAAPSPLLHLSAEPRRHEKIYIGHVG